MNTPLSAFSMPIQHKVPMLDMILANPHLPPDRMLFYTAWSHIYVHCPEEEKNRIDLTCNIMDECISLSNNPYLGNFDDDEQYEVANYHYWFGIAERLTVAVEQAHQLLEQELSNLTLGIFDTHVLEKVFLSRGILFVIFKQGPFY